MNILNDFPDNLFCIPCLSLEHSTTPLLPPMVYIPNKSHMIYLSIDIVTSHVCYCPVHLLLPFHTVFPDALPHQDFHPNSRFVRAHRNRWSIFPTAAWSINGQVLDSTLPQFTSPALVSSLPEPKQDIFPLWSSIIRPYELPPVHIIWFSSHFLVCWTNRIRPHAQYFIFLYASLCEVYLCLLDPLHHPRGLFRLRPHLLHCCP